MNKPIQFITIDNEGHCKLTKESEEVISSIDSNLAIICIAGIYRSGKSYLLNRLLGRQDGFEIGPTIASCTKGLWIWGEPVKLKDRNIQVLIIDTEGLASAFDDRNESIDMIIFCLALLLSSLFIYNSMKNIDESAIENLALVLNFSKKIQSKFKEVNMYTNNFPSFLWVLRDFALELVDNMGNEITSVQYLENALKEENLNNISNSEFNQGVIEEVNKKNDIRRTLKLFFKERDCYTLVRPVNDEKKLKLIDKLPTEELRPEFLNQMNLLVKKIFDSVRPKQIQGSYMNGKMYINLIKMYLNALNSDSLPDVKTSWKIVVDEQMQIIYKKSLEYYINEMENLDYKHILKLEDLFKKHNEIKETSIDYLNEFSELNIPLSVCLEIYKKLENKINENFHNSFIHKWSDESINQCNKLSGQLIEEYQKNPELNEIFACLDTIESVLKFIDGENLNEKKYEIMYPKIVQFFVSLLKKEVTENKSKKEEEISQLKHEKNVLEGIVDKTKEMLNNTRENYEKQIKELKDENLENRIDLEAKIDEKAKMMKNLQNSNNNTVEQLTNRIEELNTIIEGYKIQEIENSKDKKKSKKKIDDGMIEYKLDNIQNKLDNIQNIMIKTEVEKIRNQMLTEMDAKYEQVQDEFRNKIKLAKKNCEKALVRLRDNKDEDINKMKQIIKDLNDEIIDYKSQVESQEYKISLYKEKIINYEKEKKAQTDHAELLRVLALKLNGYVDQLSKSKKK